MSTNKKRQEHHIRYRSPEELIKAMGVRTVAGLEQQESEARHRRAYGRYLFEQSVETAKITFEVATGMANPTCQRVPPRTAEFCLALFLNKARGEAMIGDLSERFEQDCERFGPQRARRLYWGRALRSLWPLFRRATVRAIKLSVVVETVRKFF
jgi:hypothetical protein